MTVPPLRSGDALEQYRIVRAIGAGGMGEVYLATDERLGRRVAIKILPSKWADDPDRVRRFEQEARIVSSLNHPNIVTLFDLRQDGNRWFMATEFVEGRTVRAEIESRTRLPLVDAIGVALQCADALAAAHAAGIVHRDVKPDNVMVRDDGWVKVLDFGLARVDDTVAPDEETQVAPERTSAGTVLGTVNYLSPEQARGQRVDARTDVFSLGVVLYEMLTGVHPFKGPSGSDTIAAILRADPLPVTRHVPDLPRRMNRILETALAKDLERRYASIADFARDLRAIARESAAGSTLPARFTRRHLAGAALLVLVLTGGWAAWHAVTNRQSPPAATIAPVRTLAVLPFTVVGGLAGDEHLGLGLADALIVKLTNLRQLTVRPTNAVLPYEKAADAGEAGRALQVDAVLSGTVQRSKDRIRITAQLLRTPAPGASPEVLWTDVFPETTGDLFELQDRLAARLVDRLALELTGEERRRLAQRGTSDPRAYRLYMEGRIFVGRRSAEGAREALKLFEEAIAIDPAFAPAHLGAALAVTSLIETRAEPESALVGARTSLDRALALDESSGEAHALKGHLSRVFELRFDEADKESRRALALEPNNPMVLQWAGVHLLALGRGAEAVVVHERAFAIAPTDVSVRSQLARAYYFAKRYDDAITTGRALIRLDESQSSAYQWVGLALSALGRHDEAMDALRHAVTLAPTNAERRGALGYGLARANRRAEAREIVKALETDSTANAYQLATVGAGLGDGERALQWLERAHRAKNGFFANRVAIDPALDPLRADARFQAILRAVGLLR